MSTGLINVRIKKILEIQNADATKKLGDSYWSHNGHNVGIDVLRAYGRAKLAIGELPADVDAISFLIQAIENVKTAKADHWETYDDPDGYAAATYHEIIRDLEDLLQEVTSSGYRMEM